MPDGCSDDKMPWGKDPQKTKLETKRLYGSYHHQYSIYLFGKNTFDVAACVVRLFAVEIKQNEHVLANR